MRTLKGSGNHLRNETLKNAARATVCMLLLGVAIVFLVYRLLNSSFGLFEEAVALLGIAPLVGFFFYRRRYRIYRGGWEGEKQVAKLLRSTLSDDYFLVNGLRLRGRGGDVDHVVFGPNGVFALETKNWSGNVSAYGDSWQREGKHVKASPSLQAKSNALAIRKMLSATERDLHVEAVVVFTNRHTDLHVTGASCRILKLNQLGKYIMERNSATFMTRPQVEQVAKQIVKR